MAGMLGRSKSLRMLRGSQKEDRRRDTDNTSAPPVGKVPSDVDRLKASSPATVPRGRIETVDLQRPRTSGGSSDHGKQFHKKVAPVALSTEDRTYNFPLPSPTPTTKSATTIIYAASIQEEREGIIGIALGSPSSMAAPWHPAPASTDFASRPYGPVTEISSQRSYTASIESKQEPPKISRWKSIFGKKNKPVQQQQPQPFYQLQKSPVRVDSHHDAESLDSRTTSPVVFKPEIRESRKNPKGEVQPAEKRPRARTITDTAAGKPKGTIIRTVSSPKPPPKEMRVNAAVPQLVVSNSSQKAAQPDPSNLLLNVDIPTIEMERYSVMFGNLLQPNNRSSLLARRQGNTANLKLGDLSMKKGEGSKQPQRRATSPSLPKDPARDPLSLFPEPPGSHGTTTPSPKVSTFHRPRPVQRSKTAPAVSPSRQNFSLPRSPRSHDDRTNGSPRTPKPVAEGEVLKQQFLSATPKSRNSAYSFGSEPEEVTVIIAQAPEPWKPAMDEPQWEIISKPTPGTTKIHNNLPNQVEPSSAPLQARTTDGAQLTPQIVEPAPRSAEPHSRKESNATVGVARTISVSRAQGFQRKGTLRPVMINKAATDSNERLIETNRALTPTLVELKNRKSQRVQMESA